MNTPILSYRGRTVTAADLDSIRALLAAHPELSRRAFSQRLCEHWDWRQPSGALRDMVARSLLLALHRAGHITLPPVRQQPPNNVIARRRPAPVAVDTDPLAGALREVQPLDLVAVRRTPQEGLYDGLIAQYHYLGPAHGVGEQVKYLAFSQGRPLACLGFSCAPRHLGPRDRFIGWSPAVRRAGVHLLGYNTRFLILPWVRVRAPGLAPARERGAAHCRGLGEALRPSGALPGDLRRSRALPGDLLPGRQLAGPGPDHRAGQG